MVSEYEILSLMIGSAAAYNAAEVAQGEAKGKNASEAPTKPSLWKGTQVKVLLAVCAATAC